MNQEASEISFDSSRNNKIKFFSKDGSQFSRRFAISQREEIREKYQKYMRTRRQSLHQPPFSQFTAYQIKTQASQNQNSMPSIRRLLDEKQRIASSLQQTINRYNYARVEQLRRQQEMNRKKQKLQKVSTIRETSKLQKKNLSQSLILLHKEITDQKIKLKTEVIASKSMLKQSRVKCQNSKKIQGLERRKQSQVNINCIKENNSQDFSIRKKFHEAIFNSHRELKDRRKHSFEEMKRFGQRNYEAKLSRHLQSMLKVNQQQIKTKIDLSKKIKMIEKSKQTIENKLKNYETILKDGSTLKKLKTPYKKLSMSKRFLQQSDSRDMSNYSEEDDTMY